MTSARPLLDLLRDAPLWLSGFLLILLLVLFRQTGVKVRRHHDLQHPDDDPGPFGIGYLVTSMLGLLALLIGFTFNIAINKFELRQSQSTQEALAIETVYTRLPLYKNGNLLEPLLIEYVKTRINILNTSQSNQKLFAQRSGQQRKNILCVAVEVVMAEHSPGSAALLLIPLDDAFGLAAKQDVALSSRVNGSVLLMLIAYAAAAAFTLGLTTVSRLQRHIAAILFILQTLALLAILDLDQPVSGVVRLSDQAMRNAHSTMTAGH